MDPTGAGDSFAGGLMGYLAYAGDLSPEDDPHRDDHGQRDGEFCRREVLGRRPARSDARRASNSASTRSATSSCSTASRLVETLRNASDIHARQVSVHGRAVRRLILAFSIVVGACHHDPASGNAGRSDATSRRLPPASGTPIGFPDRRCRRAQAVRAIKSSSSARSIRASPRDLEKIDAATRSANRPPKRSGRGASAERWSARWPAARRHGRQRRGYRARPHRRSVAVASRRAARNDVRDAISRAFDLLDATQRKAAVAIFNDRASTCAAVLGRESPATARRRRSSSGGEP